MLQQLKASFLWGFVLSVGFEDGMIDVMRAKKRDKGTSHLRSTTSPQINWTIRHFIQAKQ